MSELGDEIVKSALQRVGIPFRHHFRPVNMCEGGVRTVDECMERGMDTQGYDCSGLAIASLCEVLKISTADWPRELRHTQQLASLATDEEGQPGDWRLYHGADSRIHLGIVTSAQVIHANGLTNIVEEGVVTSLGGPFKEIRVIAVESLLTRLRRAERG